MEVVTGPFHPALEAEFVRRLRDAKRDPLAPVVVVAPSRRLAARLKELALEAFPRGIAGLHVHNLYSFARELYGDVKGFRLVEDDLFHEKLLVDLIRRRFPDSAYLSRALQSAGSGRAILGAVKDLRDAGLDPAAALELMKEGGLGGENPRKLAELLWLATRYAEELDGRRVHGRPDVVRIAARNAGRLAGVRVFYYGFYELVQTQIDLFREVSRTAETTLFYPYVEGDPDFAFAKDFYDTIVRGLATEGAGGARRRAVSPTLVTASGARDEVWACAKWILEKRDAGLPLRDIGVVARTLDPYIDHVETIFRDHAIPFTSSAARPAERDPLLVAAKALLDLEAGDFRRDEVADLLASPLLTRDAGDDPILWDQATRLMGIGRGRGEWERRLGALGGKDFVHTEGRRIDGRAFVLPADQVGRLAAALRRLFDRAVAPTAGTWGERGEWARKLFAEFLPASDLLDEAVASVAALEEILPPPTAAEFRDAFRTKLARLDRPAGADNIAGVQVLDAMAARGLPFRALTLLGMNERVFPRFILEDPFITDGVRQKIHHRLGARLPVKVRGYDEERLLFALLRDAAGEELRISWQRSDERGRIQVPSIFLEGLPRPEAVPRRPTQRLEETPYDRLTPREAILRAELEDGSGLAAAKGLSTVTGLAATRLEESIDFLKSIESGRDAGPQDGVTGPLPAYWEPLKKRGLSPTSLESLATCPFLYFAGKVLDLGELEEPEHEEETNPLETGNLYHAILEAHLQGLPFDKALDDAFRAFEESRTIRFPLFWESERRKIRAALEAFLAMDRETRGSFVPTFFEQKVEGELAGLKFRGYADRIDLDGRAFRVVDYKRARSGRYKAKMDQGVYKTGRYVQPPLYFLLAAELLRSRNIDPDLEKSSSGYLFIEDASDPKRRDLWLGGDFAGRAAEWLEQLKGKVASIEQGRFALKDGDHCRWCEFRTMCRKQHLPSRVRANRFHGEAP